jgi:hypothetical protein
MQQLSRAADLLAGNIKVLLKTGDSWIYNFSYDLMFLLIFLAELAAQTRKFEVKCLCVEQSVCDNWAHHPAVVCHWGGANFNKRSILPLLPWESFSWQRIDISELLYKKACWTFHSSFSKASNPYIAVEDYGPTLLHSGLCSQYSCQLLSFDFYFQMVCVSSLIWRCYLCSVNLISFSTFTFLL